MKCFLFCALFLCSAVLGSEFDNELENNEIDVDERVDLAPTTKNPWHPHLSLYTKSYKPKSHSSEDSSDSSSRSDDSQSRKFRHKRSPDVEESTTASDDGGYSTTTEKVQIPETTETLQSSSTIIPTNKDAENLVDSEIVSSSTTSSSDDEETQGTDTTNIAEDITTVSTTKSEIKDTVNVNVSTETSKTIEDKLLDTTLEKVDKLSDQIRSILQHYQDAGVVALPGKKLLPDPFPMSDLKNNVGFGTVMTFKNMKVYGLNNFTIEHVNTDVDKLQVYLLLHMKRLIILGDYTLKSFFRQSAGPFNVTLLDVDSEGAAELQPDKDGQLQASESQMDMTTRNMKMDFKNLRSTLLQSIIDGAGIFLFDSMKPAILEKVNTILRSDFNEKLKSVTSKLTNMVSPVDIALAEARRYCRNKGYDPYHIKNYQVNQGIFTVKITDFEVVGLSRFYRVGNLSLSMDSGVIQIAVHVATEQLNGTCEWSIGIADHEKKSNATFTVDYMQVRALVNQSLDLRKHPQLHDLDVGLGRIHLKMGSNSPIDLIIAQVVNSLPKLIRHIIVDAVEDPLKDKVQEILNDINITEIVEERLPVLDKFGL